MTDDTWDETSIASGFVAWYTEPRAYGSYTSLMEEEATRIFFDWLRKVKADLLKEVILEVRAIPCWAPRDDPMGGEFDLDGESHRRVVLDTLLAYGSKFF